MCALFIGPVVGKLSTGSMPGMSQAWGVVDHTVYILQGAVLLVMELRISLKDEKDYIAQVLLELACK